MRTLYLWFAAVVVLVGGSVRWYLKLHPRDSWPIAYRYVTVTNWVTAQKPEDDPWKPHYWTNTHVSEGTWVRVPNEPEPIYVTNLYVTNCYITNLTVGGYR